MLRNKRFVVRFLEGTHHIRAYPLRKLHTTLNVSPQGKKNAKVTKRFISILNTEYCILHPVKSNKFIYTIFIDKFIGIPN